MSVLLSVSEEEVLKKVERDERPTTGHRYDFWFVYIDRKRRKAIGYEGGIDTPSDNKHFRNKYSLYSSGRVVQNWE